MFKIATPNEFYNGLTLGVKFIDGIGETDNEDIKNILINDFGYTLKEVLEVKPKKVKQSPKKDGE